MSSQSRWRRWLSDQPAYHPAWRSIRRKWYEAQHADRYYAWLTRGGHGPFEPAATRQVAGFMLHVAKRPPN